jgi:PEP-CTERM motif
MLMKTTTALALAAASLSAQALTFVETTDLPDAGSFFPGFFVSAGTLDLGANTVSGTISAPACTIPSGRAFCFLSGDTQDSFLFTVAPNTFVQTVGVTLNNVVGPGIRITPQLTSQSNAVFVNTVLTANNGSFPNLQMSTIPAGTYLMSIYFQPDLVGGSARSVPYSVAFNVSAVPEPATALLLAGGAMALWLRRRMQPAP